MRKIILITLITLFPAFIFAQEKESIGDKLIGSTFKGLAKAFVMAADINELKKSNIEKIEKMDEAKFRKRYTKVYQAIKDLPPELKSRYGITENMAKEHAVKNIESFDKKKINEEIDSIPDAFIAKQFKDYLREKKKEIGESNAMQEVHKLWEKMMKKLNVSKSSS